MFISKFEILKCKDRSSNSNRKDRSQRVCRPETGVYWCALACQSGEWSFLRYDLGCFCVCV